ncbi:hypothetical protein PVAP13_3KG486452 [Panicum virgatum]|uniref:Uncharacterized protein n=1 Tax=Panicum virgatum TaxID=38727 RepID=A0A8T0UXQ5_PANVG|nr:hypothetical protein PVAP13_3KG486452 [Panicum virgatum]
MRARRSPPPPHPRVLLLRGCRRPMPAAAWDWIEQGTGRSKKRVGERERTGRANSATPAPRRRRRGTGQPRAVSAPPRAVAAGRASGAAPLLSAAGEGWVSRSSFLLLRAAAEAPRDRTAALHVLQCRLPEEHVPDAPLQPRAPQPLHGNVCNREDGEREEQG